MMPSNGRTRREFLKLTAAGVAVAASPLAARQEKQSASASGAPPSGALAVRQTSAAGRYIAGAGVEWRAGSASPEAITLLPAQRKQEILGFGAAFTDASCWNFQRLEPAARQRLFRELFDPAEMGLSVCRTCIGSSDYAVRAYSYHDEPDPQLKNFSIDYDRSYILPMIKQARAVNPALFLLSSPWSPPGWMKSSGTMLGGSMRKKFFAAYAQYFVKFLQAYAAAGVKVNAVTSQNEVDTDQDGNMPACLWGQEYEVEFVARHLGPALEKAGLEARIWLIDHNYNLWGRAMATLEDEAVRKYAEGIAWHGYLGTPEAMTKVQAAYPEKSMYWTEGGPDYTLADYGTDWSRWSQTFTGILRNQARAIIGWNLALDERGRPNIGPFSCGGLVTVHSRTQEVTFSGQYHAFAQFARHVKRGARVFESASRQDEVGHVAFENPSGERVAVLTNPKAARKVQLALNGRVAEVGLPADSVTTVTWGGKA